jgi:predicted alpha/beta hydrolase family esterase
MKERNKQMNKQVLFIHDAGPQKPDEAGSSLGASLQNALGLAYEVVRPHMPAPDNPRYAAWAAQVEKELAVLEGEAILVGHSLGGAVLLKYLSEHPSTKPLAGLFLIAPAYWGKDGEWINDEYTLQEDFPSHLPEVQQIFLYHSRDDAVVPFAHLAFYAEKLPQATVRELDGRGHFFTDGLPELADDIKGL